MAERYVRDVEVAARLRRVKFEFYPPEAGQSLEPYLTVADANKIWVYVLLDRRDRFYVGITKRLRKRIAEHNAGRTRADRSRGPFTLMHREECGSYPEAREREKWLKSGQGREWLKGELSLPS
jgi:putative endonuclease